MNIFGMTAMMDVDRNQEAGFKTPAQIVLIVAMSIFVAEAAIMLMLRFLPSLPPSALAFSDALMLVLLVSPILYVFLFRPLVLHIQHLREVEAELLRNEEEQFKIMLRTAMDGFCIIDMQGQLLEANDAYCRLTGYSRDELLTMNIGTLEAEASHQDTAWHIRRLFEVGSDGFETRHRCKDGSIVDIEVSANYSQQLDGRVYCFLRDITERKNVEIALAESRQLLRSLVAENEAAREQERKQIAREVHDELGQILTALRMDVSLLRIRYGVEKGALLEKLQGMMGLVDRAIHCVRDVAANLRPAVLDMGVLSALEWLCEEFSEHAGIPCTLRSSADYFGLDESRSVVVFRIVQESLTNVARHAKATEVVIDIDQRGDDLLIRVRDDGKGFDLASRSKKKSFGLLGMHERAIALGGDVDIISAPGRGTTVSVRIPMTQNVTEK